MPLPKYTIQPSRISLVSMPPMVDNELEFVSNETFCNLMHQMASVVSVASNIFNELSSDLSSLTSRICQVEQSVVSISAAVKRLSTSEDFLSVGLQNPLVPFSSQRQEDSQVLNGNTKPACMRVYYEQAQAPPPLHVMDALRDDGKTTSRLYSDPRFFFELWRQEMLDDYKLKKTPKKKRPKSKSKATTNKINIINQPPASNILAGDPSMPQHQLLHNQPQQHTQEPVYPINNKNIAFDTPIGIPMSAAVAGAEAVAITSHLPPPPPPPTNQMEGDGEGGGFYQYGDPHLAHPNEWGVMQQHPQGQHMMPMDPLFHPQYPGVDQQFTDGCMEDHRPLPQDGGLLSSMCESPPPPPPPPMDLSITPGCNPHLPELPPYMPSTSPPLGGTDLPPPPQSLTDSDCGILNASVHQERQEVAPPPPTMTGAIPPPPPPPAPAFQPVFAQLKKAAPKALNPLGPPRDLLSDIRAGFALKKASDRQLPSRDTSAAGASLGGHKKSLACDVSAIYEMVSRRRQCMENTSEDDDDKTSESCGWDD